MLRQPFRHLLFFWLFLLCIGIVGANSKAQGNMTRSAADTVPVIIDSIIIENNNIYDTDKDEYDNFLFKLANKFHIVTRERIIKRELLFAVGDTILPAVLEESERNLRQYLTIYDADITVEPVENNHVIARVVTYDQWSLSVGLDYRREGSIDEYKIGATEKNLFGTNIFLLFNYAYDSREGGYIETSYINRRLFKQNLRLLVNYNTDPTAGVKQINLSRRYLSLDQRVAYSLNGYLLDYRYDIYRDNENLAEVNIDGHFFEGSLFTRHGSYTDKFILNLYYIYSYQSIYNINTYAQNHPDSIIVRDNMPKDSLNHKFILATGYNHYNYIATKNLNGMNYTEDYNLGFSAQVEFGRAFTKDLDDYSYDRVQLFLIKNLHYRRNWLFTYLNVSRLFKETKLYQSTRLNTVYFYQPSDWLTFVLRGDYTHTSGSEKTNQLILGGSSGIRGFEKYFLTGSRRAVFNFETRFFSDLSLLSMTFGGVVFSDFGNAWNDQESVNLSDFHKNIGLGLRIGFKKSSRKIIRVDFSYTDENTWELTVGSNQYFNVFSDF